MFALVDCNNFYASCERVFDPGLIGKPVVILSNNDGCVIARSSEAKSIGIKMGIPAFQIEELLDKYKVAIFSSNYTLYGDLSNRVMQTLASISQQMEIYSIDEAFIFLENTYKSTFSDLGENIRRTVSKNTGIPVGIGIAPTKTLAKIANHMAKSSKNGVVVLDSEDNIKMVLKETPIKGIWGIGPQHSKLLEKYGIKKASDFVVMPDNWIKKNLSVVGLRTKNELLGKPCIELEENPPAKQAICTSRSFGKSQNEIIELEEAVSTFASHCAMKLRLEGSAATDIMVFIHTNAFRKDLPQYARNRVIHLPSPTNSNIELVKYARLALHSIFKKGYQYKKAGVIVMGLVPENEIQQNLFEGSPNHSKLMETLDRLNAKHGSDKIKIASMGFGRKWKLRQEKLSPNYTTKWEEIITINLEK